MGPSLWNWSRIYWVIFALLLFGLILKSRIVILVSCTGYMIIAIIAFDANRKAKKKIRRGSVQKLPDDKLTHDLRLAMKRLDEQERRDEEVRQLTSGMGSVGDLDDIKRRNV